MLLHLDLIIAKKKKKREKVGKASKVTLHPEYAGETKDVTFFTFSLAMVLKS
jgi:hypothetical protein